MDMDSESMGELEWLPYGYSEQIEWRTSSPYPPSHKRDMWTTLIIIFLCIWRHRNDVFFNGAIPSHMIIREKTKVEYDRWHRTKIFRGVVFSLPEPADLPWHYG
jgi:hypothetical protein